MPIYLLIGFSFIIILHTPQRLIVSLCISTNFWKKTCNSLLQLLPVVTPSFCAFCSFEAKHKKFSISLDLRQDIILIIGITTVEE
jgi:hypothetical protein